MLTTQEKLHLVSLSRGGIVLFCLKIVIKVEVLVLGFDLEWKSKVLVENFFFVSGSPLWLQQTSSELLWRRTQTLLRSTFTQKMQAFRAAPATVGIQSPTHPPWTPKTLPPAKQPTVSAPTSARRSMMAQQMLSPRNTTRGLKNKREKKTSPSPGESWLVVCE